MLDRKKARFPLDVIFFCADCNRSFGKASNEYLGFHFICPEEKKEAQPHLARVILKKDSAMTWLRWERKLLDFQMRFSQFSLLRKLSPKIDAGASLIIFTLFLLVVIFAWPLLGSAFSGSSG
jgi:hypothetical protein